MDLGAWCLLRSDGRRWLRPGVGVSQAHGVLTSVCVCWGGGRGLPDFPGPLDLFGSVQV